MRSDQRNELSRNRRSKRLMRSQRTGRYASIEGRWVRYKIWSSLAWAGLLGGGQWLGGVAIADDPARSDESRAGTANDAGESAALRIVPDWHEADDLETFSSVCVEKSLTDDLSDDSETIVIDVDSLGAEPRVVILETGEQLQVSRVAGRITISLERKSRDQIAAFDDPCVNEPAEQIELRPIPEGDADRYDAGVAEFQVEYAVLLAAGKSEQAQELAAQFLGDDDLADVQTDLPRRLPEGVIQSEEPIVKHRVGYHGKAADTQTLFPGNGTSPWDIVQRRLISFSFRGASLAEVAPFLRSATGMTVELRVSDDAINDDRIHLECTDLPIGDAIDAIGRASGMVIVPVDGRLIVAPAHKQAR